MTSHSDLPIILAELEPVTLHFKSVPIEMITCHLISTPVKVTSPGTVMSCMVQLRRKTAEDLQRTEQDIGPVGRKCHCTFPVYLYHLIERLLASQIGGRGILYRDS